MLKSVQLESLPYQNENLGPDGIEDMTALNYLHEAAILYNVKKRFLQKLPYTYTGDICIAVNPYQWLPELYSEQTQSQYLTKARDELPPHVYATSMASYNDMKRHEMNQSILVSGESGAGKTETTKILMNHLASIAGGLNDYTIKKIIEVNPLLESFGNAKTVRNDNSSRFGKFTQLQFDNAGILVGARCRTYLLEKTRVISHEEMERNYHIFYQLLAASESKEKWFLDDANECYAYTVRIRLSRLRVEVQSKNNNEESEIVPSGQGAKNVTKLLGISEADLEKALISGGVYRCFIQGNLLQRVRLQKFTQDVFKTVQIEYEAEGIIWSHIDFADNQDVISVIEDRLGIISLLNDEVMRPKGNDESLVSKLSTIHKDEQDVIEFPRTSRTQFTIKHYAGAVTYESLGFLEKHKDALLPDLSDLMRGSSKQFLRTIFTEKIGSPVASRKKSNSNARRVGGRAMGGALTVANVGTQFKDNLNELMTSIRQTKVHYVRCIKPNQNKSPNEMDQPWWFRNYVVPLQAIVKLQSVARCVIMMNRYQSFKTAVITLQAHWRGYKGRCIALEAKKNKSAIIIQKYARRFVKRKQFKDERKGAVKIQAFLRMKYERPKYIKALQEKKQQADMKYQLSKLQERLHDEQRRNAELKKDRLSTSSTDSQLYAESNGTRSRGRSIAHMWMADADGIISQLNEEANRLRKENEEQRALTAQLKSEVEKLKFDQTVLTANFQVKIRGFQDTIREKDKKLEAVERECVKLRELVGSDPVLSSQRSMRKDRRSVFRRLGSKKEFDDGYDNGDASRASTAMQAALAQRSAETAQFLRQSARRMSRAKMWRNNSGGDSDGEGRFSGSDMGDSGGRPSLLQEVSAAGAGAMESLKNRLTAVKEKYYGEEGPSAASRQNTELRRASAARESFNLDALPLPPGWETRLSRSKGKAYYCNPTLRITQWDHPSIESSKAKKQAAVSAQRAKRGISTAGSTVGSPPRDSIDGVLTMEGHI
ncbi:P-loop containing nucleoside triphosphate hydrolase [Phytophthora cactorum]|nr:P-loop containing nucleoside triphosphate hydrolase [Phytophthora cactorum]